MSGHGNDLDACSLGVFRPVGSFTGKCMTVLKMRDEDDPKLVVVPQGKESSDDQFGALTEFIERFYDSYVVRS